jgi:hypothetical protein
LRRLEQKRRQAARRQIARKKRELPGTISPKLGEELVLARHGFAHSVQRRATALWVGLAESLELDGRELLKGHVG